MDIKKTILWMLFGIACSSALFVGGFIAGRYTRGNTGDTASPASADAIRVELAAEGDRLRRDAELDRGVEKSLGKREAGIVRREAIAVERDGVIVRREAELGKRQDRLDREGAVADREGALIASDAGTVADVDQYLRKALEELGSEP